MKFEEFIKVTSSKINPNSCFGLLRDARLTALEKVLIEKGVIIQEEIDAELEKGLGETAENILKMPPIPKDLNKTDEKD